MSPQQPVPPYAVIVFALAAVLAIRGFTRLRRAHRRGSGSDSGGDSGGFDSFSSDSGDSGGACDSGGGDGGGGDGGGGCD